LAGIIGSKNYSRAAELRTELLAITMVFLASVGSAVLVWNHAFVRLWVGGENYAGQAINLLLVLIAAQTAFIRCDAYIIDAALQPNRRVQASAVAAIATLAFTIGLTWLAGMPGLCLGILAGRATQMFWYPVLVRQCLGRAPELSLRWLFRPVAVMAALFGLSAYLGQFAVADSWLLWTIAVSLTLGLALGVMLAAGLPPALRQGVLRRVQTMLRRGSPGT
jgi:hypothetical protein